MKELKKLLIVGGGTAGYICALILKKHLNIQVDVVYSSTQGIVGVGEGSTEHFKDFMDFIGINQYDILKECDATYKSGIIFNDWGSKNYMHNVGAPFMNRCGLYSHVYAHQIAKNDNYIHSKLAPNNLINRWFVNRPEEIPFNQFHFNTYKLNEYLSKIASSMDITLYDDDIDLVTLDKDGNIDQLKSDKRTYDYDFYVDATGFKRILMNHLGAKWQSYGKYLKMKSAFAFPTEDTDEYNMWTLAKAMKNGWLFRIPVWGRHGNGYIFDSDFVDIDDAKKEVEELFGKPIDIRKEFKFDPGCLDKVWIKNCVAIGLSGSFVEPLEATSIGTTIQQSFLLMNKITNYNEAVIDSYNQSFTDIMENIRDFLVLHYITDRRDSEFWKYISTIELPDSLSNNLELWKSKLPIDEEFSKQSNFVLFKAANYITVMDGLNMFDREAIGKELSLRNPELTVDAMNTIKDQHMFEDSIKKIGHKEFIRLIRNHF